MNQKSFNFSDYALGVAKQDARIAAMRLELARKRIHHLEHQNNWYEHAPLSWMLRKLLHAFDEAVTKRMTGKSHVAPVFDADVSLPTKADADPKQLFARLSASYRESVHTVIVNDRPLGYAVLLPVWWLYRALRKSAKLLWRAIRRGR